MARTRTKNAPRTETPRTRAIRHLGTAADPFARFGSERIALAENPNRGKRHTAPAGAHYRNPDAQVAHGASLYSPLTVSTPLRDSLGRRNPRSRSQYTV